MLFLTSFTVKGQRILGLRFTPIVGYERVMKYAPTVHTKDRLTYGLRINLGPRYFSLEAEYTQGKDTEDFPDKSLNIKEESQKLKAGIRSAFYLLPGFLKFYIRGGLQARKKKTTTIASGITTIKEYNVTTDPYAGSGFTFRVSNNISATGGVTIIFTDKPNKGDKEYQTSLGLTLRI